MDTKPTHDDEPELTPTGKLALTIATPLGLMSIGLAVIIMGICMHYLPGW